MLVCQRVILNVCLFFYMGVEGIDRDCQSMACDLQYVG